MVTGKGGLQIMLICPVSCSPYRGAEGSNIWGWSLKHVFVLFCCFLITNHAGDGHHWKLQIKKKWGTSITRTAFWGNNVGDKWAVGEMIESLEAWWSVRDESMGNGRWCKGQGFLLRQWLCVGGRGQTEAEQKVPFSELNFIVNPIKNPDHIVR